MIQRPVSKSLLAVGLAALASACSGGGGGGSSAGTTTFQIQSLSLQNGAVWEINREIVFTFTEPVDFTTVSANTINIRTVNDVPATGVFHLRDANTVVFQPNCPTLDDFSDAGLRPGGESYILRVAGLNSSANTVRSMTGVPLGIQQTRSFTTPISTLPAVAFRDIRQGPPVPVVRSQGSTDLQSSYLEIGRDADNRVYFELDGNNELVLSQPGFELPLNLYSDSSTHVAVLVSFNQPVNPSSTNISASRLRLEYRDGNGVWRRIEARASLEANCTETGATVRLEPRGVLPPSSALRAVVLAGFQDLVGEPVLQGLNSFAVAPTRDIDFSSLSPSDVLSDEINEGYAVGGSGPDSLEDTTALFDAPVAEWGSGRLSAAFSFDGSGGPNGTFDWVVRTGEIFFFDTTRTPIVGGPDGIPTATQEALNGVVDVRNLIIEPGGEIRVQGLNPMRINATGDVKIFGRLDVSGFAAKDVATLNTGNQIEIGGAGAAAGGKGGNANDNITGPTVRGGRGAGPFRQAGLGGEGGEMGFSSNASKNARRPGGGGGGRFAKDVTGTVFAQLSQVATAGTDGFPISIGAVSGVSPSRAGQPGPGPFIDTSNENDFFGVRPIVDGINILRLVRGELPSLWAGYGGGGGGNAGTRFPNPGWNFNSDEKGGGGGGGAGGIHIKAIGRIVFGEEGELLCNGARGGTGENTNFLDHVGGTGGAGSGGHVILESATQVDFTNGGTTDQPLRDVVLALGPLVRIGGTDCVDRCNESALCCVDFCGTCLNGCTRYSNGGAGGAGVVQIHVPDPAAPPTNQLNGGIVVPIDAVGLPDPLDRVVSPPPFRMVPTFGRRSKARSRWISIGGADQNPDGSESLVRFLFEGTDTEGKILTDGSTVRERDPLVADDDLDNSTVVRILPDGLTLELTGAALASIRSGSTSGISNDVYLRTPALFEDCSVRLFSVLNPGNLVDYPVASAAYDEGAAGLGDEVLTLTVTADFNLLTDFNSGGGPKGFRLLPRFFQVVTSGVRNLLPESAFVQIRFRAARDNGAGAPDETNLLVPFTTDISEFNAQAPGALQFFQYEVEFDLDKDAAGISEDTEPVTLDFLKIPFVF